MDYYIVIVYTMENGEEVVCNRKIFGDLDSAEYYVAQLDEALYRCKIIK